MELRQKSVDAGQWAAALGIPLLLAVLLGASELAKAYYSPGRLRLDAERLSLRLSASEGSLWLQRPFQLRRWLAVDALGGSFYLVWDVEQDGGTVSFCYPARRKEANASPGRMITKPYGVFLGDGGREVMRRLVERAAVVER